MRDFFAPPPPEVGPVIHAWTTLEVGDFVWPTWLRMALYAALTLVAGFFAIRLTDLLLDDTSRDVWVKHAIVWALAGMGGLAALWLVKSPRSVHECSYVGRDGVAVFTLRSGRRVRTKQLMAFSSADGLYRSDVHQYLNHIVYGGTSFSFEWCDAEGRRLIDWCGGHTEKDRAPRPNSLHNLATATEAAWNAHRLRRAATELAADGYTSFRVGSKNILRAIIRVGPGIVEIATGRERVTRLTPAQVKEFRVAPWRLMIHTQEASLLGSRGKFDFASANVADLAVLMTLADRVFLHGEAMMVPSDRPARAA
jgi:hypothetical protein